VVRPVRIAWAARTPRAARRQHNCERGGGGGQTLTQSGRKSAPRTSKRMSTLVFCVLTPRGTNPHACWATVSTGQANRRPMHCAARRVRRQASEGDAHQLVDVLPARAATSSVAHRDIVHRHLTARQVAALVRVLVCHHRWLRCAVAERHDDRGAAAGWRRRRSTEQLPRRRDSASQHGGGTQVRGEARGSSHGWEGHAHSAPRGALAVAGWPAVSMNQCQ
jgi:hypothetical protein